MTCGKASTDAEKGKISAFVKKSFFQNPPEYRKNVRRIKQKKHSVRERSPIVRFHQVQLFAPSLNQNSTLCTKFKSNLVLNVSREIIRRAIHKSPNTVRVKTNKAPNLKPIHKENGIKFMRESMACD